jgi:S-adenosylmethionine:tRNA ribosyltransferase-isomerase
VSAAVALEAARAPERVRPTRLLHVDAHGGSVTDRLLDDLPALLDPGDLVVVNDAATLPASLTLTSHDAELRLAAWEGDPAFRDVVFLAVLFGHGNWQEPTEARGAPPRVRPGELLVAGELRARVVSVDAREPRLVRVRFEPVGAALLAALYRTGRVVQYSYLERPLELWDVQNGYASRPWAVEPPSAGLSLTFALLTELRRRGIELARLSHAAGLSSTGSASLDRRLPFPERYEIPAETVLAVARARAAGTRVVAVGTTVVRALESAERLPGGLRAGEGHATLVLGPGFRPRAVDGVLSGLHEEGTSHFSLLEAFAPRELLQRSVRHAAEHGYLQHEFGDVCLVMRDGRAGGDSPGRRRAFPES